MTCLPDSLQGKKYYRPTTQGAESEAKERLAAIENWKKVRF